MVLPFYQVFDDIMYQQAFVEYLKELVGLNPKPPSSKKSTAEKEKTSI